MLALANFSSATEYLEYIARSTKDNEVFDVAQYPLAGNEDKDLRYFANQGIVLSVNDENVDSTEKKSGY